MQSRSMDLTEGPLFRKIILYTIPIICTGLLQLAFNAADLIVVGRFCGSHSVGAVGATNSLTSLLVNFFIGLSVGAGATMAHAIGMRNDAQIRDTLHTATLLALFCGVVVTVIGLLFSGDFLRMMGTPEDVIDLSAIYLKIYFSGSVFNMVYNFGASMLRADGDTRSPLIYLSIAGVLNVILNVFFVTVFAMDVAGVALATIVSQAVSAVLVLRNLSSRQNAMRLEWRKLRLSRWAMGRILGIGLPAGLQSSMFSISNVLIQSSVNSFGADVVAGNAAASSLEGFTYVSMNAFTQTAMNFVGQNAGAGKMERMRKSVRACLLCCIAAGLLLGNLEYLFARPLLGIYITDSPQSIEYGVTRLLCICVPYFLCGIMDCMSGSMRGMGMSIQPMLITVLGVCGIRIMFVLVLFPLPAYHNMVSLFLSYPVSWLLTFLVEGLVYLRHVKRLQSAAVS